MQGKKTWEVAGTDEPAEGVVVKAKVEGIGQVDGEGLLGFDDGQRQVGHRQLTGDTQRVEGNEGTVPQPELCIRGLCNFLPDICSSKMRINLEISFRVW